MPQNPAGQVIWCLGMYASASTWAFNAVRQILQASGVEPFRAVFASGSEKRIDWRRANQVTIVKSHEITGEARILDIARHSSKLLITLRDPRDCVVSMMQAHEFEFSRALLLVEQSAVLCAGFAKDRRTKLFRYETGFFQNAATITAIAGHLGYALEKQKAEGIHQSLTRSEVEKYIESLPKMQGILTDRISGDLLDPKTQWHSHHAGRNGAIGKWQNVLSQAQLAEITTRFEPYSGLLPIDGSKSSP